MNRHMLPNSKQGGDPFVTQLAMWPLILSCVACGAGADPPPRQNSRVLDADFADSAAPTLDASESDLISAPDLIAVPSDAAKDLGSPPADASPVDIVKPPVCTPKTCDDGNECSVDFCGFDGTTCEHYANLATPCAVEGECEAICLGSDFGFQCSTILTTWASCTKAQSDMWQSNCMYGTPVCSVWASMDGAGNCTYAPVQDGTACGPGLVCLGAQCVLAVK